MSLINKNNIPRHVAIIMDGNGRWAKANKLLRVNGHKNGINAVKESVEFSAEIGVKFLTLFAFSSENWNRPSIEVNALMNLLLTSLKKELPTLQKNNIKLNAIGNIKDLNTECNAKLLEVIEATKKNSHMTLNLALSYSSRAEILNAINAIVSDVEKGIIKKPVSKKDFESYLYTENIPYPDLLIRTSGEYRISNFLLWQIAYSELYFCKKFWPDFGREDLKEAIINYQKRERRYGQTSEQIQK